MWSKLPENRTEQSYLKKILRNHKSFIMIRQHHINTTIKIFSLTLKNSLITITNWYMDENWNEEHKRLWGLFKKKKKSMVCLLINGI